MKVKILSVSLNPSMYDLREIVRMSYEEAEEFFLHDTTHCCAVTHLDITPDVPQDITFHADGVRNGDGSDTMFNWLKVTE